MNQYPGYGRGATGMQGMGYGVYDDPSSMGRMGHSRGTYPMPQYQDGSQMQRMMHQQGGMYPQDGYMGQHSGNGFSMGGYANYSMPGMSQTPMGNNMSMMMPGRQGEMVRMDGHNNMMNSYYSQSSGHGMSSEHSSMRGPVPNYNHGQNNAHSMQGHQSHMARQGHMSMSNQGQISTMSGPSSNQSPMPGQTPSQASVNLHGQANPAAHSPGGQATSQAQLPPGRGHPMTSPQSSSGFPGQGSPHMPMMPHRQPTQGPVMSSMPGSGTHQIPQHPMRHPNNQQNPQEVADNILQIASSYPTNQTVQVPLKSRPAPYHIPRSPHYSISHSSEMSHPSPNPHHQQQQSPAASSSQPSPTPSSSSVKSPTPVLAPIPNPIPSPGISGLRSPCNQGISPCNTQRSPVHMGSMYTGHGQAGPPPHMGSDQNSHQAPAASDVQQHHYSPAGVSPAQNYSHFSPSPSGHRNASMYSAYSEPCSAPGQDKVHYSNTGATAGHAPPSSSSSPCVNSRTPQVNHSHDQGCVQSPQQGGHDGGNNPLMSLQKLVMLPETQVVDPKSVVNDACLSSQQPESNEGPKNVENPAEGLAEGSSHSVGCSGQSSPLSSQPGTEENPQESSSANPAYLVNTSGSESQGIRTVSDKSVVSNLLQNGFMNHDKPETIDDCSKTLADSDLKTTIMSVEKIDTKCASSLPVKDSVKVESKGEVASINQQSFTEKQKVNGDQIPNCVVENGEQKLDKTEEESNKSATDIEKNNPHLQMNGDPVVHSLEKKSPKVKDGKEEVKRTMLQCRSTSVLSEVPVVTNGLNGNACGSDEELEQECVNGVHPKVQNSFTQLVRAKLGYAKKASSLVRTTPCSIAVGADEREACERFAFRRNGYCRTLRTSRIIYNGRSRTDSTGNADSDESVENVSDSSFQVIGNPQDGNRKRTSTTAKRGDYKNSNISQVAGSNKKSDTAPKSNDVKNDSNGCVAYNNSNGVSDDEEVLYYEGVDSSDFFINSSDESIVSTGESKPNVLSLTPVKSAGEKSNDTDRDESKNGSCVENDNSDSIAGISNSTEQALPSANNCLSQESVSSPPAKRLRRSSGPKTQEKSESPPTSKALSDKSHVPNISSIIDLTEETSQKKPETVTLRKVSVVEASSNGSGGPLQSVGKRRPLILGKKTSPARFKLPQAIVVLEKADAIQEASVFVKEEKIDIDISDESCHVDTKQSSSSVKATGIPSLPSVDLKSDVSEMKYMKMEEPATSAEIKDLKPEIASIPKANSQTVRKKKPQRNRKGKRHSKGKSKAVKHTKHDDVKDSFKSMKFSRTLDLMKSRRKRDSTPGGPFLRLEGVKSRPQSVTVFNQSPHASLALGLSTRHKNSRGRQTHHMPTAATVHMISSLPSDKVAMVSSTRTISQKPWVCAFCGHRSSYRILGDLFGPYYKETQVEQVEKIAQEDVKRGDSSKEDKSSEVGVSTRKGKESNGPSKISRRRKSQRSDAQEPEPPEEIWVHEMCALWAAGVYLIGSKLYGLDDAVRDASETICSVCKSKGAMMGCLHKGCSMKYHCLCAADKECLMDEENLSLLCPKHKEKRLSSQGLPSTSGTS